MRPSEALTKHRDEVLAIIACYPVANPRIFGSVSRGEDKEGSDVDILVDDLVLMSTFELADLEMALEAVLNARVDVRLEDELDRGIANRVASDLRPL